MTSTLTMQYNNTKINFPFWTKLKSIPTNSKFHVSYDKKSQSLIAIPIFIEKVTKIFKYSFSKDLWNEYTIQPNSLITVECLAEITDNKIYLISANEELIMLEIIDHTNQCTIKFIQNTNFSHNLFNQPGNAHYSTTNIEHEFYYISNNLFIKYNLKTKKHQILRNSSIQNINPLSIIPVKNSLMFFCQNDYDWGNEWTISSMQQYDIENNHWKLLPIKLPNKILSISTTTILRQQMILIAATDTRFFNFQISYLAVYELQSQTFKELDVYLPRPCTDIFAINDKNKDILITKAWIKNNKLNKTIPVCIEAMITEYYINEMIHIIDNNTKHYQFDVFQILNFRKSLMSKEKKNTTITPCYQ